MIPRKHRDTGERLTGWRTRGQALVGFRVKRLQHGGGIKRIKYVLRAVDFSPSQERRVRLVVKKAQYAEFAVYNRILRFWTCVTYLPTRT